MLKRSLLIFGLLFVVSTFASAQTAECKCSAPGDAGHAKASCSAGSMALCTCSASACTSRCVTTTNDTAITFEALPIVESLRIAKLSDFSAMLSKSIGRKIEFTANEGFKFDYPATKISTSTHWDILDMIAPHGRLKIDGMTYDSWRSVRSNLQNGSEVIISTGGGNVQTLLNEISFISGKRYTITGGNASAVLTGQIKGKSIGELVQNLSTVGKVTISEK